MKPPSFEYHRPRGVAEALRLLADLGPDAKVLAGGQSLVPLLNMRLAAPRALVDINRLTELGTIEHIDGAVRVGALVRHTAVTRLPSHPLLAEAARHVAHPTIRNRGTCVGSLVHADPAAELPAVLLLTGGAVTLASRTGTRTVAAGEFFVGPMESAVRPGELAVAATFPLPPGRTGSAFVEISRRAGDYALVGVALSVTLDDRGEVASARAAYVSVGPTPVLVELTGAGTDWAAAAALAQSQVEPEDDIHASAEYRRHLVGVLTRRAGELALSRAKEEAAGARSIAAQAGADARRRNGGNDVG